MGSKEHNLLAIKAESWLANRATARGMRGATEVYIDKDYVADYAGFCSLSRRLYEEYCKHSGLKPITIIRRWYNKKGEMEELLEGDVYNEFCCVIEAKHSRVDFLKTFGSSAKSHKNRHSPVASLHWCVTQRGVAKPEELPDFWGLLVATNRGLREIKKPKIIPMTEGERNRFARILIWPMQSRNRRVCSKCGCNMRNSGEDE